ncbi:MAG: tRNA uridine-5-carboxymethylaminomethyl(34) synthesis enzyme MnmG [Eubacteriales bacterium]|jgi:tRNA uridine 5-carboxymethylaminomethyl modification enzyme
MRYLAEEYDLCVIGAGHAGIEASLAAARLGVNVVCFTINMDTVGNLPCNPSIGGTAKGVLVREIDALGGEMAKAADETCIQFRLLNRGKGPAVQSPRAQADRRLYQQRMKHALERQPNISLKQGEIVEIVTENGAVKSVLTALGAEYPVKAVIIATGTFLGGRIIVGEYSTPSGPDGMFPATKLSESIAKIGLSLRRFKTGTPPRVNARTVDFDKMIPQYGEDDLSPFSFQTEKLPQNKVACWLTYTNENTHRIIRDNLYRAPMYSGEIKGVGPRYCPSIEDKIVKFANKDRHPVFVEPMGLNTEEMYLQGISTSLPEDVQIEVVRSVKGLERAEIMRPAYAIEYDCVDPLEVEPTLELKKVSGLYGAGQFIGTSGYEEAAALGIVAGINAALKIKGKQQIVLDRSNSYIGTLIDDLVTKGTTEPYRIMTSRSEYRLLLRQDNADLRLTELGYEIGLVSRERYEEVQQKYELVHNEIERIKRVTIKPTEELNDMLIRAGTSPIENGVRLYELIKRPQLTYEMLADFDESRPDLSRVIIEQIDIATKYEGYIKRQQAQANEYRRQENRKLPSDIDYNDITGISFQARQKLNDVKPRSIGQASRIPGVSPADMVALIIWLDRNR